MPKIPLTVLAGIVLCLALNPSVGAETIQVQVLASTFDEDGDPGTAIDTVRVNVNDTVEWVLIAGTHTVTSGASSNPADNPGALFDAPLNNSNPTFSHTFGSPGTFPYFCRIHEHLNMRGIVEVAEETAEADFGDAPDDDSPGFGPTSGQYPSLRASANGIGVGPYHRVTGLETLGEEVSTEADALVPDADSFDEGFRGFAFLLAQAPTRSWANYFVRIDEAAPAGPHYLNVAADLDRDGRWQNADLPEWVGANTGVDTVALPSIVSAGPFAYGGGDDYGYSTWLRASLTRTPIDDVFGEAGWDGSGPAEGFEAGETEDFFFAGLGGGAVGPGLPFEVTAPYIRWLPHSLRVSDEGSWVAVRVCNPASSTATNIEVSLSPENSRLIFTPASASIALAPQECRWVRIFAEWAEPGESRTDVVVANMPSVFGTGIAVEEAPDGSGAWAPLQVVSPAGAALTGETGVDGFLNAAPALLVSEVGDVPFPESIGNVGAIQLPAPLVRVFYAVEIVPADQPFTSPMLLELPLGPRAAGDSGMAAAFGVPAKYDPNQEKWIPIPDFQIEHGDGTVSVEVESSGVYGIIGCADEDVDTLPDVWEADNGLNPANPSDGLADTDGDFLANPDELLLGTAPDRFDTDGDEYWDSAELARGSDPNLDTSVPADTGIEEDVNRDGVVNAVDVQMVVNGVLGIGMPFPTDVNKDGKRNAVDVQRVVNAVLGVG